MNSLHVESRGGMLLIKLRVSPAARKSRITGAHGAALRVAVSEPPQKGRANEGVLRMLSEALRIPIRQIELVSGHAGKDKRVAISDINEAELRSRLDQYRTR